MQEELQKAHNLAGRDNNWCISLLFRKSSLPSEPPGFVQQPCLSAAPPCSPSVKASQGRRVLPGAVQQLRGGEAAPRPAVAAGAGAAAAGAGAYNCWHHQLVIIQYKPDSTRKKQQGPYCTYVHLVVGRAAEEVLAPQGSPGISLAWRRCLTACCAPLGQGCIPRCSRQLLASFLL